MEHRSRPRLTPFGAIVLGALVLGLVALFAASHVVQTIGFTVVVVMILILLADRIPERLKWFLTPPQLRKAAGITRPERVARGRRPPAPTPPEREDRYRDGDDRDPHRRRPPSRGA
jgi:hypothetical protein